MQVRQLIGPYAGRIVDMPDDVAQSCLAQGTVCLIDDIPRVRGLSIVPEAGRDPPPVDDASPARDTPRAVTGADGEPVTVPDDWADLPWPELRSLAARISDDKIIARDHAVAAVAAALGAE